MTNETVSMNAKIFAGFLPSDRAKLAVKTFGYMYEVSHQYWDIVEMMTLIPSNKEIVEILEKGERRLDQLGRVDIALIKNKHNENFENFLDAVDGSCAQELKNGSWKHTFEAQKILVDFAGKSGQKKGYWENLILKDILENPDLKEISQWVKNAEGIKNCIKLFKVPTEKIQAKVEKMILERFSCENKRCMTDFTTNVKLLLDITGFSQEGIQKSFYGAIRSDLESFPLECMKFAKEIGLPAKVFESDLHRVVVEAFKKANTEESKYKRHILVEMACNIYMLLEKDPGVGVVGDELLKLWRNKESKNPTMDVLRKASELLHFDYNPRGFKDWAWYMYIKKDT